ncbi:hypothetical protein [Phytohabitans houttuyneae]|uniref:Uncharacterized protein n=1 Tax=Phytohabitans houttuyneae TaxID=1076126 RepID=A0A6V8K2Y6_9ACTN|nr:hypothetical protein [Phytohabitans houttuyneae]GFJ79503.1 hypothetical protein Phou_036830 [Phytohabitans houttuyneae]
MTVDWTNSFAVFEQAAHDAAFADIIRQEAKRTILCPPDQATRVRWLIDQAGIADILTVVESQWVPAGTLLVVDQQAIEAEFQEDLRRPFRL